MSSGSTTRRTLWRLCACLLGLTVVVFGASLWAFRTVHASAETARDRTAPAILEVAAARLALVRADRAAMVSFRTGAAELAGPGQQFQNQIALASQSLAQVAEDNAAGAVGSRKLQLVEGLLASYSASIGQADGHFRPGAILGAVDLWYASRLLHAPEIGILAELDRLLDAQHETLREQIASGSITVRTVLLWLIPAVALLVLLCATQVFFSRRFRRTVNPALLLATVLVVGLFAVMSLALVSQQRLVGASRFLDGVILDWRAHSSIVDNQGQHVLADLVSRECGAVAAGRCGETVPRFVADLGPVLAREPGEGQVTGQGTEVGARTAAAACYGRLEFLIPVVTAAIAILVPLGFRARFDEYRYRSR